MGFYGNITDTAKTQFQFDIIYPNRKAMDEAIHNENNNTDGVHIGRFVLVSYGDIEDTEYSNNFNIDADVYGTRRGYDGTVWQKVFTNNIENYIMIAELNTIMPQFDIGAADAPSMVPLIPHFGSDSTNIYYKLHWSPTWGFRVKAANADLCGPELNDDGSSTSNYVPMSADDKHYLSDENTLWHNRIGEDTYVFDQNDEDVNQGIWTTDDDVNGIPAAIYYNKAGFNPAVISYGYNEVNLTAETYIPNHYYILNNGVYEKDTSNTLGDGPYYEKIDDHIQIEPTGYSGHLYNIENNEHTVSGSTTKVDTQELSIMLPTLGNTIAAIWDLIYGDRVVNNGDYRNLDIAWESARERLQRKGLRLVQDFDGAYQYKTKNVDTIAGAINSVHDLMGMIIISDEAQNLNDQIDTLSEDRIYYDQTNGIFKRKCRGYEYTEIDDTDSEVYNFVPVEVESEDYQAGIYYIENNNDYVLATGDFDNSNQYYLRSLQVSNLYSLVEDITDDFNGLEVAYKEYFGKPGFYDYIRNEKYYNDKDYYTWTSVRQAMTECPLTDEYEANKFYYFDGNGFYLDASEKPVIGRTYYQYKKENSHTVASLNKDGVYMANKYAYATDEGYEIDNSPTMRSDRSYFELIPQETTVTETIYIKEETYEKVIFDENTQYVPYVYYVQVGTNEYDGPRTENTPQEGVDYYKRKVTYKRVDNQTKQFTVDASKPLNNLIQFHTNEFYKKEGNNFIKIQDVADLENQDKFSIYVLRDDTDRTGNEPNGGTYILNDIDFTNEDETAMLKVTNAFYQPNIYYYQTVENPGNNEYSSYLLDVYPNKTENRTYYSFDSSKLVEADLDNVFEPYKYYLKTAEDRYELILTPTRPRDSQNQLLPFYKRNQTYYIVHDDANIYKHGSVWNYGITYVPSSVTLATREECWQFKELKGFARDITTMHGLILKIKTLLDSDNEDTRDLDTVKGALNTLNDKIAKLDIWGSGQFIIVDDYGRLHGAEIVGQDGIKVEVDSNINSPKVVFSANFDVQYEEVEVDSQSYQSGVYYIEDNGVYVLDERSSFTSGETYYKKSGIDITNTVLDNYYLDPTEKGEIEAGDSLRKAFNKLENKVIDVDTPIIYNDSITPSETFTLRNLYEDKLSAEQEFEYESLPEIQYSQEIQNYWRNYNNLMERASQADDPSKPSGLDTYNYYRPSFTSFRFIQIESAEDFVPGLYYRQSAPNTFVIATEYNAEESYYEQYNASARIYLPTQEDGYIPIQVDSNDGFYGFWYNYLKQGTIYTYNSNTNTYLQAQSWEYLNYQYVYYIYWTDFFNAEGYNWNIFVNNIHSTTCSIAFTKVSLTAETFDSNTNYYIREPNSLGSKKWRKYPKTIYDDQISDYWIFSIPRIQQAQETVTTSIATLWDTFFPVGSVYTTSDPNPPQFGGTWELINKQFKPKTEYIRLGGATTNYEEYTAGVSADFSDENFDINNYYNYSVVWNSQYAASASSIIIIRHEDAIEVRVRWVPTDLYSTLHTASTFDNMHILFWLNPTYWGLQAESDTYYETAPVFGHADGGDIAFIAKNTSNGRFGIYDYITKNLKSTLNTNNNTITNSPTMQDSTDTAMFHYNIIINSSDIKQDSACDQFVWKRIS